MNKRSKNQKGFTAVEGLLIVLIVVVISAVGYMVYHDDHKTNVAQVATTATKTSTTNSTKSTTIATTNSYAGWKTYCSSLVGACFKYNPSWTFAECAPQHINYQYFQDCGTEGVSIILPDETRIDWDVELYEGSGIDNCNANQTSYPGLTYSDITQVSGAKNVYYVNIHDGYNEEGGYTVDLALLNGDNGQPAVGKTGALCPTNPIFIAQGNKYTISFDSNYSVNTNPGQTNIIPSQTDQADIKQVLLSFYYQ